MASISTSGGVFGTGYQTNTHHTEQTVLTAQQLADAKVDRFFLELSGDPASTAATLVSSGLMTFADTGTVQTNAQVENSYYNDSSSAHMEPLTGAQFSVGDWNSVTDTGVTYDFIVEPKLIGLRFDSYQGVQEGSPVVGYLISMQSAHYGSLDNLDGHPKANVTYVAYPQRNWRINPICGPIACRHMPCLGHNQPERDLILSPRLRLRLSSSIIGRSKRKHQALVSIKDLLQLEGVDVVDTDAPITYYHIMTPQHQLIIAHGCLGETLFTGP